MGTGGESASARPKGNGRVAVVGVGSTGLCMLKALREDGYSVTAYERRDKVGGIWAYTDNTSYTTVLPATRANLSKFTCGFSDYPMPDKYPTYMQAHHYQEYMEDFAKHFDLLKDIIFGTSVKQARRNSDDTAWLLDIEKDDGTGETVEYDKIVFCSGYQTKASIPTFEGQDKFEGTILHSQAYRNADPFKDKKVVVIGLSSTSGDIIPDLMPVASKVYVSHRRGALPFKRYHKGTPQDLGITWRRRQLSHIATRYFPRASKWLADTATNFLVNRTWNLDPTWRLTPVPSITLVLPGSFELVMPLLQDGSLTSLHGITRFVGPKAIEFADGTVVDDVDAVILCTGYGADWNPVAPFIESSATVPNKPDYKGPPLYRLYMNLFPPKYADSCVLLNYSAFGKNNGFSFASVTAWAVSNVLRGAEPVPSREEMEAHIDRHHEWVADRWAQDKTTDTSAVRQWEFQRFLHTVAGTGMAENLGWGWKGWLFWLRDRKLSGLMNDGVETAHAFSFFETGKRPTWEGARDEILRVNDMVKGMFPAKKVDWPPEVESKVFKSR
ncbi:flavin-containing monooxygenase 9 [Apodospora peruviana]|uniref:Flavin-containing monooxygenase 9 n=1 Tax=Apodospora peruviana TaxID=516989 RepID=A0AAE0I0Z5_9PEZI|nr:flavin-containing monooxygenase 9 [Apodospora peruviana]